MLKSTQGLQQSHGTGCWLDTEFPLMHLVLERHQLPNKGKEMHGRDVCMRLAFYV
jgi:hypothetical protein